MESIESRLAELQKWVTRGLVFMVVVSFTGIFVAAWVVHSQNQHIEERAAQTEQVIACFIEGQYDRTVKGLPTNSYYKDHPKELTDALNNVAVQRAESQRVFGKCRTTNPPRPA